MEKPGRDRAPSPLDPGDSATRQEVYHERPPVRSWWGGYHLARPRHPRGPKVSGTRHLKPRASNLVLRVRTWSPTHRDSCTVRLAVGFLAVATGQFWVDMDSFSLRVGGHHARVPYVYVCAGVYWPGLVSQPSGYIFVCLTLRLAVVLAF